MFKLFLLVFVINCCSNLPLDLNLKQLGANNFLIIGVSQDAKPEVKTPLGVVRGYWKKSLDERQYAAFEGIPYAKPPVGDLRFEEPQPIPPWTGVWEATTPHSCPQNGIFSPDAVEGQEDCLYLNVYVPAKFLDTSHKLDVIFVIHGGAFMVGSGHNIIRSEWFMDNDVVLVTINYRLGIFGFLSTEDAAIPGNNGMKDQVLALEWVKDNINSFGGNPSFVTIVGMSAGGASSHLHYFSPLSKDLFAKGVSQSGTALAPWAIKEHPLEVAKMLAVLAGCPDKSTDELKSCLKQRPMENLMKLLKFFHGDGPVPKVLFAPVIEKGCKRPFLDKDPYVLLKQGKVADAPWITSHATDDGLMPAAFFYEQWDMLNKVWTDLSPHFLDCNYTLPATRKEEVSEKVLEFYLGKGEKISKKNFKKFTQIFTDRYFAIPGEVAAKMQSKATTAPVYYYVFNYKEGANRALDIFSISPEVEGVAHGEDGVYFYGFGVQKPFSEQDKKLKNACHTMLYSFSASGLPSFGGKEFWKPTGDTKLTYLNVTGPDNLKLQTVEKLSPIDFWNSLGLEEHENVAVKDEL